VDPFALIIGGGVAVLVAIMILLGLFYPGTGAKQLRWQPTRSVEVEATNEIDDIDQMLEAATARRGRRGAPELTEAGLRAELVDEMRKHAGSDW
jgi:hypothetical protein